MVDNQNDNINVKLILRFDTENGYHYKNLYYR